MPESHRKQAHILRSFKDAGTGVSFEAGQTPMIDAGSHANYKAAGLIGDPSAKSAARTNTSRTGVTSKSKSAAKRKSPSRTKAPAKPSAPVTPAATPDTGSAASGS